jgi:hypothetical protein
LDEIRRVDLNHLTPLQAMQLLEQWQQSLEAKADSSKRKAP